MVKFGRGFRHGSRYKMRSDPRQKFTAEVFLRKFAVGQRVALDVYPAMSKGMFHHRMQGLVGVVKERRGDGYVVAVPVGGKTKTVMVKPEHLHTV